MKIVKCSECGKYIHKADKCFHCGNTSKFHETETTEVHENIAQDYSRMEELIEGRKFEEAMSVSYTVLEWMPNLAGVFWMRLLAKNKCSTAIELLSKGFSSEQDSDFCNALDFSAGEEHSAYEDIQKAVTAIRNTLKNEISKHEYKCKSATNIMRIKETIQGEFEERKKKLYANWDSLAATEYSLYALELDCLLLTKEHQTGLAEAAQAASAIKLETEHMKQCTGEKAHALRIQMENALQRSKNAKDSIENMRMQHDWVKEFEDLADQREQKLNLINSELESLSRYEQTVQQTISEIERIEARHKSAFLAADRYDFTDAAALFGEDIFNQILSSTGLALCCSTCISTEGLELDSSVDRTQCIATDDEMGAENYNAAWGLDED